MSAALATRIAEDFAAAAPPPSDLQRQRAMQLLLERGLPTSRDENWKYVNLRPLEKARFAPPPGEGKTTVGVGDLPATVARSRYTFIDGVFSPALSAPTTDPAVSVTSMQTSTPRPASSGS